MASLTLPEFRLPENNEQTAFLDRRSAAGPCLEQDLHAFAWTRENTDSHPQDHPSETPGAYRCDPEHHDPTIPETDPRSPRYEPPHLRHRPGDTWIIDTSRPYDPEDPGPYGSPGWRQDTRTGRHRRGEHPDPLPAGSRDTDRNKPRPSPNHERRWLASPQENTEPRMPAVAFEAPERFSRLREAAWDRFLSGSQILHDAHYVQSESTCERLISLLRNMLDLILRLLGIGGRGPESDRILAPGAPDGGRSWAMNGSPEEARPVSSAPYIAQWERQFDTGPHFRQGVSA